MDPEELLDATYGPNPSFGGPSWNAMIVFIGIALYNVLELNFLIAYTFKTYKGLYFWSMTVATWGIAFNAVGYLLRILQSDRSGYGHSTLILIGWSAMVTGQSLVLYSRLHFVLHNTAVLRGILAMIIVDGVWLGVPVIVFVYGSNSSKSSLFIRPYAVFERIQLCVFTVQELIISGLYIFETSKTLSVHRRLGLASLDARHRLVHLILANVLIVLLDTSVLVLEFTNNYDVQTAWKALVYSVKLKVEFSVLNWLVEFSKRMRTGSLEKIASTPEEKGASLGSRAMAGCDSPIEARYSVQVGSSQSHELDNGSMCIVMTTDVAIDNSRRHSASGGESAVEQG
ncbi:hypothetical protein CDD80_1931 [Ophiocordyceps camponoti-rufipedis]|uniref:DUF7703 domain-containing protein n=1 Tax=Ophiocordyceps camponoti-rufipedis TaxID=2004952 RepID=A0A2C5Z281_9HYPO|nr:hypothetical protein CDD80_1931 [Ophiocordyceps camponoti-rufipedis]